MNRFVTALAIALIPVSATAQNTLYKVVDPYGNVTYQDRPPEGDVQYEARPLPDSAESSGSPAAEPSDAERVAAAAASRPLVFFTVPKCDSCDFVRWFLDERGLPYEEVDVESDIENQRRLREATGEYRVPVLMIGDEPLFGYDREDLLAELESAGYVAPAPEPEPAAGETEGSPPVQ